jgi:hypothetical protein
MTHELSTNQRANLESNRTVWRYISNPNTQKLHRGLATCVEDTISQYPRQQSRAARVHALAVWIRELDENVPEMAKELNVPEDTFCELCATAALNHDGGDYTCGEPHD